MTSKKNRCTRLLVCPVLAFAALPLTSPAAAQSENFEITIQAGAALPFYSQTFSYDPGDLVPPDIPVGTSGGFSLEATGGLSLAGGFTWWFSERLGLEARIDSAEVDLDVTGGRVTVDAGDFFPELPSIPLAGEITGEADVDRLTPMSLNLQAGFGERTRFLVSGGLSYVPSTSVSAAVRVQLGLDGIPGAALPPFGVSANATVDGGFGGNLGVGVRVPLSGNIALALDGRVFGFPTQELRWGSSSGTSEIEEILAAALDPIEFEYGFFHATGGVAFSF